MVPQIEAVIGTGVVLDLRAHSTEQTVSCDRLRLKSGLLNVVLNARDAMDDDGLLTISVRLVELDGRFAEVVVTDTGQGTDEVFAAQAFEPYVTTKVASHGTGLGLFQLRSFVESSRGFVRLSRRKGSGTSVTILLPMAA
jgi:signal transduction histidine kinase